ncbi:bZIP family transcription factor [Colletotrichum tofieldiae]|nr:bZIP family transcription factor [Colletotrichum tofieldiae]
MSAPSKERSKAQSVQGGGEVEGVKKRLRGRPRLDKHNESAIDRRRTQIRLAQRAYRNRKESAIQELQKEVEELKSTNEKMSEAFMKLYDFVVSKGIIENTPGFGRQLEKATKKFV